MPSNGLERIKALFAEAMEKTDSERRAFLDQACGKDATLRAEVEAFLMAAEHAGDFLISPTKNDASTSETVIGASTSESLGSSIGSYKLLEKIGEGGFGTVYMAEQEHPIRRKVALKIIKLGMDTKQVIARFEAERQALAMMDHPSIAKVFEAGATHTGRPYFVMELVHGVPITEYCDSQKLTTDQRIGLFIQVCQAIQHAHQKGVIHRDIKPNNVLVTMHDDRPVPKIIDFGIAKATSQRLTEKTLFTEFRQFVGTPAYMSPEQAQMNELDIDTRSDIYSLGVLLYELLTGTTPFDAKSLRAAAYDEIRRIIREEEPPTPSTRLSNMGAALQTVAEHRRTETGKLARSVRGDLDWLVMKCLEKDRTRRYETASDLARDAQRFLNDEPVEATPPSATYRLRKFVRRNRGRVIAAAASILFIILASLIYIHGIQAEQHKAEQAQQVAEAEGKKAAQEQQAAEREARNALHAAAVADTRYLTQEELLPDAMPRAQEAFALGGKWEDANLYNDIYKLARRDWRLTGHVDLDGKPLSTCFAAAGKNYYFIVAQRGGIRIFDATTGGYIASRHLDQTVNHFTPSRSPGGPLAMCCGNTVTLLHLPDLATVAQRVFPKNVIASAASNVSFLLLQADKSANVVKATDLSDIAVLNSKDISFDSQHPAFQAAAISPNGTLAVMHGGHWNTAGVVWHISKSDSSQDKSKSPFVPEWHWVDGIRFGAIAFVDEQTLVSWFSPSNDGSQADELNAYQLDSAQPKNTLFTNIPSTATKGVFALQAWTTDKEWMLGFDGRSGCVIADYSNNDVRETRYMNLLPFTIGPGVLSFNFEFGYVALVRGTSIYLFHQPMEGRSSHDAYHMAGFSAAASELGLVMGEYDPILRLTPADPAQPMRTIHYEWIKEGTHVLWNTALTPDAKSLVLIAQESNEVGGDSTSNTFGKAVALLYKTPDWSTKESLPIVRQIPLISAVPTTPWEHRITVLSPDGGTLLYWTDAGIAGRYSTADGTLLSHDDIGKRACRSRDGQFVAGTDTHGTLRLLNVPSGQIQTYHLDMVAPGGMCFDNNASRIFVANRSKMECIDAANGAVLWSRATDLLPVAWPMNGDRFVAFQYDRGSSGGNIILADTTTFLPVAILSRNAAAEGTAFFNKAEDALFLEEGRWTAQVIHNFTPDVLKMALTKSDSSDDGDIVAALPSLLPAETQSATLPATALIKATDLDTLKKNMNQDVMIEGTVTAIRFTRAKNAINLEFEGRNGLLVYVAPAYYPTFNDSFGGNGASDLLKHLVRVTGHLTEFNSRPEIVIKDPLQCTIVDSPPNDTK